MAMRFLLSGSCKAVNFVIAYAPTECTKVAKVKASAKVGGCGSSDPKEGAFICTCRR